MTKTNDWTNFSARLEAALGRKIAEAPWEPWLVADMGPEIMVAATVRSVSDLEKGRI